MECEYDFSVNKLSLYLGLSSTNPDEITTEPGDPNYSRRPLMLEEVRPGWFTNSNEVVFEKASIRWPLRGSLEFLCIFDSPVGGNLIHSGKLNTSVRVLSGDRIFFQVGTIDIKNKEDLDELVRVAFQKEENCSLKDLYGFKRGYLAAIRDKG